MLGREGAPRVPNRRAGLLFDGRQTPGLWTTLEQGDVKKSEKIAAERGLLLCLIDEAFDKKAWHGPNLRGSIRLVSPQHAVWRPGAGRHNILEIVVHCAYWKYAVRRQMRDDRRGSFPLKGSNWFKLPTELTKQQWRDYVALLDDEHRTLRRAIANVPLSRLSASAGGRCEIAANIYGVAMHDIYHAGQVRTIKTLCKQATRSSKG